MADPTGDSREALLQYLEQLSGRSIRTRAELDDYLNELEARAQAAQPRRAGRRWSIAKHATLGVGLLIALLQYYLIDIYVQIETLQHVRFLSPDAPVLQKSAIEVLRFLC
jgi:hypothetical protein